MSCTHCGLPEDEHHAFEAPPTPPPGCVCKEPWEGVAEIPPICPALVDDGDGRCDQCEHDLACHAPTVTA